MRGLTTMPAERDAWLIALLDAFELASCRTAPVTAKILADVERHLFTTRSSGHARHLH